MARVVSRWIVPLALFVLTAGMSAMLIVVHPNSVPLDEARGWIFLCGAPLLQLLVFAGTRRFAGQLGKNGDLILNWFFVFLSAVQALLVMHRLERVERFDQVVPFGAGLLFIGFGPAIMLLEPNSPLGIRLAATRDRVIWRKVHRILGIAFGAAGLIGMVLVPVHSVVASGFLMFAPLLAVFAVIGYARRLSRGAAARDESDGPAARLPEKETGAESIP